MWPFDLRGKLGLGHVTQHGLEFAKQVVAHRNDASLRRFMFQRARRGSRHGKQLLHHDHARDTLQTAFHRDALIVRALE
jgi:hypothetical protein